MKHKTILSLILAAVMLGAMLSGCGSKGSETKKEEAPAEQQSSSEAGSENTGIANPWSDVGSAEEAAKGAGIDSFVIAEDLGLDLGENFERTYRCMEGIAEARLEFAASALTVRKGTAAVAENGDISGDYNKYANTWTQDVGGIKVTCAGNRKGEATKAIWSVGDMYYSMNAEGLGGDEDFGLIEERLTKLVNGVQ